MEAPRPRSAAPSRPASRMPKDKDRRCQPPGDAARRGGESSTTILPSRKVTAAGRWAIRSSQASVETTEATRRESVPFGLYARRARRARLARRGPVSWSWRAAASVSRVLRHPVRTRTSTEEPTPAHRTDRSRGAEAASVGCPRSRARQHATSTTTTAPSPRRTHRATVRPVRPASPHAHASEPATPGDDRRGGAPAAATAEAESRNLPGSGSGSVVDHG